MFYLNGIIFTINNDYHIFFDIVYPSLDASDDEDSIFKPKAKSQIDEAWNPKARVGPLLPKTNRPAREGVKKTSVEKGLEAAAAKRAKQSVYTNFLVFSFSFYYYYCCYYCCYRCFYSFRCF